MFREILNEKIGNILLLLSNSIPSLYLTKALKFLYIIDETSVKASGVPITWLDYKVWKFGPVPEEVYDEFKLNKVETINGNTISIKEFVNYEYVQNPYNFDTDSILLKPNGREFNNQLFSEFEIELFDEIINKYKDKSSKDLVKILHEENSLWHRCVEKQKIIFSFELNVCRSNYSIDFTSLLENDSHKQQAYKTAHSSLAFNDSLNSFNSPNSKYA